MFLRIIFYTIKRQLRDKQAMIMLMAFPIILILVLGSALSGAFKPSSLGITSVTYFNQDKGYIGKELDALLLGNDISQYLDVELVSSREEGEASVANGENTAFIYLEDGYTDKYTTGEKAEIVVYMQRASQMSLAVIEGILDSFSNGANTMSAIYINGSSPAEFERVEATTMTSVSKDGKIPGSLDYYAVTMLVMTLMYGTLYGGIGMGEIFFKEIGKRISTTPAKKSTLYLGSMLGFVLTIFIQGSIVVLFTKFVYNVYWGNDLPIIFLIIFIMSFMSVSMGTMVGMITKEERVTTAVLQTIVPVMTFISSGYFKFQMSDPAVKELVSSIVPNAMAHTALFNTIYGGPAETTIKMMVIITIAAFIFLSGAIIAGRRKMV